MGLTCTDLGVSLRPASLGPGHARGRRLHCPRQQLSERACSGNNSRCGSCTGQLVGTGDSCAGSVLCPAGDFCHPATEVCTLGSTIVHGTRAAVRSNGRAGGRMHWRPPLPAPDGGSAGTCGPPPATIVVGNGETCDAVHTCGPGLVCFTIIGGPVMPSTCIPTNSCGSEMCDDTSFCATDGGQHCAPDSPAGTPCRSDAGRSLTSRQTGLYCANSNVCTAPGTQGAACDDSTICAEFFLCVGGRCQPLSTETCSATPDGSAG